MPHRMNSEMPPTGENRLSPDPYPLEGTPAEASFNDIVRLAAQVLQIPVAMIQLAGQEQRWIASSGEIDAAAFRHADLVPLGDSGSGVVLVLDTACDERFTGHALIQAGVRFYAAAPLRSSTGGILGKLYLFDFQHRELSGSQRETFERLANLAAGQLETHVVDARLREETMARQEAVDALLASESRFRSLVEYASDIITLLDADGTVRYESPAVRTVLGYSPDELLGRQVFDLVHQDDLSHVKEAFQYLAKGGRQGPPLVFRFRHKDGSWRTIEAFGANRLDDPAVGGIVVNSRDVTERAEAEASLHASNARFQSAFDESAIGIALVATDGRWLSANRALCQLLGYTEAELLAIDFQTVTHPDDLEADLDLVHQVLRGGLKSYTMEKRYFHHEGNIVWAQLTVSLVRDQNGTPLYFISQVQDISDRKQAETSLLEARDEAERQRQLAERARAEAEAANLAKSEFLSRISHELRTPLNAILGFGQLLELSDLSAGDRQSVQHILKGGRHLLSLINEVLDIARIESGALSLSPEPVSIAQVCIETLDLVRPLAAQRNVTLDEGDLRNSKVHVLADRQRLKQVLLNFFSNAIKYNHEGGRVEFRAEPQAKANGTAQVRLIVNDTGPGIPPEKLERLFTPFDRLGAEATDVEGTGIGLALSQRLVNAMRGRLGVSSEVGVGSSFWVELPEAASPLDSLERAREQSFHLGNTTISTRWVVLCIEDNLPNLQLLNKVFARRPAIRLLSASQGAMGLQLARQHHPDLILLDLHVPEMDGQDVLANLRQDPLTAKIPIIVISADATPKQIDKMLEAGATAYLAKPFDVGHLLQTVDNLLAVRETTQAGSTG
jgi:PAS domain S-box-containing protein